MRTAPLLIAFLVATTIVSFAPSASASCHTETIGWGDYVDIEFTWNDPHGPPGPYSCALNPKAHSCLVSREAICTIPLP